MGFFAGLRHFGHGVLHVVFPNSCWLCQKELGPEKPSLCAGCEAVLTADPHVTCPRCASTVGPYSATAEGCIHCRDSAFSFDRALRLGPYDGLLRDAILRIKYGKEETLGEVVGNVWGRCLAERLQGPARIVSEPCSEACVEPSLIRRAGVVQADPDVIVPIPLHWTRAWSRGFNQSEVLAQALSRQLRKPCSPRVLRRVRRTPSQAGQASPLIRRENMRKAFAVRGAPDIGGKVILLVDDVLTTGATASAAAAALRPLKPAQIIVAVLAHDRPRR